MKKINYSLMLIAAAAVSFTACQKEVNDTSVVDPDAIQITVKAVPEEIKTEDGTRTYIDGKTIKWGTGEYMMLALTAGEATTFATSTDASADAFKDATEAMFEFSVSPSTASEYVYQGLYPASAAATSNNTNAANYKVNLPAVQNATAASYDPAAYIMVAKPETFSAVQTDWVASFRRATALNKVTLKNVPSGVSFNKVKITATGKKLAGGRHINLTTGESADIYANAADAATIEVKYATAVSGTNVDVWFTSWDAEIAEGEKLTIVAYTTDSKSYTKEITVPAGKTISFKEGFLNTLGANLSGIAPETVSEFTDGDYVILAKKDNSTYYALKGEASGTRIASVDYSGSTTSYNGDASLVWTITTSGAGYTIKNGSNFIGWTSGNYADLIDEASYDATKCLMGIEDNGNGTYKIYVAADDTRILARNQSNAYFAFYTGTQYKDLVLVPATTLEAVDTPTFNPAAGEVASGTEVTISTTTSGATIYYTTDGTDPTTSSTQGTSVTITATTTVKAIAVKEGMADSAVATATYTVQGAGSVTLTDNDITAGDNTVQGTNNSALAYRLGTSSNNGSLTFPSGYTSITFTLAGWASGTRSFSITNGTIGGQTSLSPDAGSPSGTINAGFSTTYTGTEYTIDVTDPSQEVVFSGRRCVVWGFTAVAGASVTWNLESIAITTAPTKTTYTAGQTFNPAGMVVTGHFVDADDATNTKDEAVTGYTITPDGALATTDTQVTITYQGKTATQNITVNAAPAGNDGSLEHPYTASEARALALNGDTGSYYISGIVTKIVYQYDATHGTSTFWIDENGTSDTVFEGYGVKYFGNVNWVEGNAEIALNDEVIIYGTLMVFNSTTPEATSAYLVSLNGKTKGLTLAAPTVTTNASAKQITVAWTAATGTESAISYIVKCGTLSYNATAAGSHTFTMADYGTYDVSVEATASDAVSATVDTSVSLTDPSSTVPSPETITFADAKWGLENSVQYSDPFNGGNFTITFAGGGNDGKYYTTGSGIRTYGGGTITIASSHKIKEIAFTWSGSSNAPTSDVANPTGYSSSTNKWTGSANSVTLTRPSGSGHWRLQSVTVTYEN